MTGPNTLNFLLNCVTPNLLNPTTRGEQVMPDASILIVEDEAIIALGIQDELEKLGYRIAGLAFKGEDALRLAETNCPDLALMDINLHGKLDGIDTATKLKQRRPIPIVFLTAMVDDETIQRAKVCEPNGYILKPVRQDELRTSIEYALYKHKLELQLLQSEARFRELFETSLDGIVCTDLNGEISNCNSAFSELIGYSIDELKGMNIGTLTAPEYIPNETYIMKGPVLERGFSDTYIKEYLHRDGSRIPASLRVWNRKESESQPVGYWGIVRDITSQRESEQKILRQANFAEDLVKLTTLLSKQVNLPELLDTICLEIAQALDVEIALITLSDPENGDVTIAHHYGPVQFDKLNPPFRDLHHQFTANGQTHLHIQDLQGELTQNPNYPFIAKNDIRSAMIVKLTCESRLVGTLDLASIGRSRQFSNEEMHFLLAYANQAAIAIDRARLLQQARNRADELEILGHLSTNLRSVVNPQDMLPFLLDGAMELAHADSGIIYLLGPASNPIDKFARSCIDNQPDDWFSPGGMLWARALADEEMIYTPMMTSPPKEVTSPNPSDCPIQSIILLSLRSADALAAILALGFTHSRSLEPRIQTVLSSLAEMGGNALHRSGLMKMLEKRVTDRSSELSALYDLSVFVNSPNGFENKLDGALYRVAASVGADYGVIYHYDPDNCRLLLATQHNFPEELFSSPSELWLPPELKNWLDTSTIPWLANCGDGQSPPIKIVGASYFQTIIYLPIRFENHALGLLCILWKDQKDLSPESIAFLIALTERIGSAIQNEILRQKSETAVLLEERQRLARELHDSVTQSLYSQTLLAEAGRDLLAQKDLPRLGTCLNDLQANSLQAMKEMRLLLFELHPPLVGAEDLSKALSYRLEAVERRAGVMAHLDVRGFVTLPAKTQGDLYRVALEALNNSLKHSGADTVRVVLHSIGDEVRLSIEDNGIGFDAVQNHSAGMGLFTMQERVSQLGGSLEITSTPGKGTKVAVKLKFDGA